MTLSRRGGDRTRPGVLRRVLPLWAAVLGIALALLAGVLSLFPLVDDGHAAVACALAALFVLAVPALWRAARREEPQRADQSGDNAPTRTQLAATSFPTDGDVAIDARLGLQRAVNNPELYAKLRKKFFAANQDVIAGVRQAMDAGDATLAHRTAHTLKSTAAMLGADGLAAAAREVELLLADGDVATAGSRLPMLEAWLAPVLAALRESDAVVTAAEPEEEPAPLDREAATALLKRLEPLLRSGRTECQSLLPEITITLRPLGAAAQKLTRQIEEYEFDMALETAMAIRAGLNAETAGD